MLHNSVEILFEKFEIIECLKKDSHSSVFIANHIYLGKKIILKTLNSDELSDKSILARFKREAKILAKLDHPNLIKVLDFGSYNNSFYLSFEYFPSRNLRQVIKENHLTFEEKGKLIIQLMRALNFAHQNEIIHRDIKPENILINSNLDLKIADFGLAQIKSEQGLTQKSSIVGTPSYMSPEQIRGEELTHQSDLFSAGIVSYELLNNTNPFLGKDISETINNILNYKESDLINRINQLPEYFQPALKAMLKKNSANRAKSAVDVLNLLGIEATFYHVPVQKVIKRNFKKIFAYSSIMAAGIIILFAVLFLNDYLGKSNQQNSNIRQENNIKPADSLISESLTTQEEEKKTETEGNLPGKLFIDCQPWADIYINNKKIDTTPLKNYIQLSPGLHRIKLVNPNFPPVTRRVNIVSDELQSITVDLRDHVGYLDCKINPWGDIYINGELKGTTPLREPLMLAPGKYLVVLKNPEYQSIEERVTISAGDTLSMKINFTFLNRSSNL
jgi:serine/threonine-protein kinase